MDTVVADAVGERLPGAPALRETLRRRRATGGPAEQTFATLIGLELRPRRLRAAAELWAAVGESRGTDGRDALWADPGLLPSPTDLDDPAGFVDRDKKFAELLAGLDDLDTSIFEDAPAEDGPGKDSIAPDTESSEPPKAADEPDGGAGPSAPRPV